MPRKEKKTKKKTCSYFNMVGRVNDAVHMPSWWWIVIYSFVGIPRPLKTWLLIEKKKKKRGWTKDTNEIKQVLKVLLNKLQMLCSWLINTLLDNRKTYRNNGSIVIFKAFIQIVLSVSLNFIQYPEQLPGKLAERNFLSVITKIKNKFLFS